MPPFPAAGIPPVNPDIIDLPPSVRHVSMARGLTWWTESFSLLFADVSRLGTWVAIGLTVFVITALLHLVPFVGSIVSFLLSFVLFGGLVHAADATAHGRELRFAEVFSGFGERGGSLFGLGLLVLIVSILISAIMIGVGLGTVWSAIAGAASEPSSAQDPLLVIRSLSASSLLLVGCALLFLPVSMSSWLAPALVILRGVKPWDAMKLSLSACWRNSGAITLYGIAFVIVLIAATVTLLIGWLFLIPMLALSTYAAYRDMFE